MNRLNYFSRPFFGVKVVDNKIVPTITTYARLIRTAVRCSQTITNGYIVRPAGPEYWDGYKGEKK